MGRLSRKQRRYLADEGIKLPSGMSWQEGQLLDRENTPVALSENLSNRIASLLVSLLDERSIEELPVSENEKSPWQTAVEWEESGGIQEVACHDESEPVGPDFPYFCCWLKTEEGREMIYDSRASWIDHIGTLRSYFEDPLDKNPRRFYFEIFFPIGQTEIYSAAQLFFQCRLHDVLPSGNRSEKLPAEKRFFDLNKVTFQVDVPSIFSREFRFIKAGDHRFRIPTLRPLIWNPLLELQDPLAFKLWLSRDKSPIDPHFNSDVQIYDGGLDVAEVELMSELLSAEESQDHFLHLHFTHPDIGFAIRAIRIRLDGVEIFDPSVQKGAAYLQYGADSILDEEGRFPAIAIPDSTWKIRLSIYFHHDTRGDFPRSIHRRLSWAPEDLMGFSVRPNLLNHLAVPDDMPVAFDIYSGSHMVFSAMSATPTNDNVYAFPLVIGKAYRFVYREQYDTETLHVDYAADHPGEGYVVSREASIVTGPWIWLNLKLGQFNSSHYRVWGEDADGEKTFEVFFYNEEWQSAGQPLVQFQLTGFVDGAEPRVQRGESLDSVVSADQNGHFWYPLSLEETPLLRVVEGFDSELMQQSLDGAHPFVASWREQVSVHEYRHQLYQYVFKDEERLSTVSQYPQTFQLDQYWPYPAALGMKRSGAKVKLKAQEAHLSWWLSINQGKAVEQAESMSHFPEMNTLWDKWRHYASDAELVQESSNVMFQCRFQHWGLVSLSRQKGDLIESHGWGLTHATPNDLSALSGLLVYCPDAMHEFLYTPLVLGKAKLTFENNMVLASASMSPLNVHWLRKFGAFRDHRSQGMLLLVSKKTRDNSINIKIITACRLSDYGA